MLDTTKPFLIIGKFKDGIIDWLAVPAPQAVYKFSELDDSGKQFLGSGISKLIETATDAEKDGSLVVAYFRSPKDFSLNVLTVKDEQETIDQLIKLWTDNPL